MGTFAKYSKRDSILKLNEGVHRSFTAIADATGTVVHNCNLGHHWYHTSPDADFTANFTNLDLSPGYYATMTLVIVQGGSAFEPTAVQIDGASQTIIWAGNSAPTGTSNGHDIVTFKIVNVSGTFKVLGELKSHGG